jgi:hypothetical protein
MLSTPYAAITKEEAQTQLDLYKDLPELTPHEKSLMDIYAAVLADEKVISLPSLVNDRRFQDWPVVAVAPVRASSVTFVRETKGHRRSNRVICSYYKTPTWTLNAGEARANDHTRWREVTLVSRVPSIHPLYRNKVQDGDLILWEVSDWRAERDQMQQLPSRTLTELDPIVVRAIPNSEGLYKVIAAWDLTQAEARLLTL